MSDSDSDFAKWNKTVPERDVSSPFQLASKRFRSNDSSDEPSGKKAKLTLQNKDFTEDVTNYLTQPPMLLFKHFLNQQEDDILVEDAMRKYNEYKESFACEQLQAFFESHKDEEWFMEKYHPDYIDIKERKRLDNVELRRKTFMWLLDHHWLDDIGVHVNYQDLLIKFLDATCILLEGGNEDDLKIFDRKMFRGESPDKPEIKIDIKHESTNQIRTRDDFGQSSSDDEGGEFGEKKPEKENKDIDDKAVNTKLKEDQNECSQSPPKADSECAMMAVDGDMNEKTEAEPRSLHKTSSIFLRNIHPNVFRSQIEELVKPFPGFLRIAMQDPMPERKFLRRGWITFDRSTDVKDVSWQLNKTRLHDIDLGAVVNKDISQRVRPVEAVTNHRAVMRQDVKYAAKLVARFDKRRRLWETDNDNGYVNNPLLCNITEYLVDEGSYEEEAYLGGNINNNLAITGGSDPSNIPLEEDLELARVLDRLILYLRMVHSFDYYCSTEYVIEDDLPHRCGFIHARGNPLVPNQRFHQRNLEEYMRKFESRAQLVLDSIDNLDFQVASRLGVKSIEEAVEKFISDNTKEITTEKWLCPLSGKKFKGPDYVRKHIFNKFADRVKNVEQTVQFFNNYILDPRRPQLPEHASNRPSKKVIEKLQNSSNFDVPTTFSGGHHFGGGRGGRRDGHFYRKSGRSFDRNNQNSSGSYYSRKILNYNDVNVEC